MFPLWTEQKTHDTVLANWVDQVVLPRVPTLFCGHQKADEDEVTIMANVRFEVKRS